MEWDLTEAIDYYKHQGAPGDQNVLKQLLREVHQHNGGQVPLTAVDRVCESYSIKKSLVLALVRRTPSLRLSDRHCLELCAGPNCGKHTVLAAIAEKRCRACGDQVELKYVPCMRMCGKGPNIRWDGKLYHQADEVLIEQLTADLKK